MQAVFNPFNQEEVKSFISKGFDYQNEIVKNSYAMFDYFTKNSFTTYTREVVKFNESLVQNAKKILQLGDTTKV